MKTLYTQEYMVGGVKKLGDPWKIAGVVSVRQERRGIYPDKEEVFRQWVEKNGVVGTTYRLYVPSIFEFKCVNHKVVNVTYKRVAIHPSEEIHD